jgi:hypothetical protein
MDLRNKSVKELRNLCKERKIKNYSKLKKNELINVFENQLDIIHQEIAVVLKEDTYDIEIFMKRWEIFKVYLLNCNQLKSFGIRMPNFPEDISENLVKFVVRKYEKDETIIWSKEGDLLSKEGKCEVKCFSSSGPSSFGPTEKWNILYFLDATKCLEEYFIVYKINLSNISDDWKKLKLNKKKCETFLDQCNQGRRPRIHWEEIKKQINPQNISKIFQGYIKDLLN